MILMNFTKIYGKEIKIISVILLNLIFGKVIIIFLGLLAQISLWAIKIKYLA